jgi:hypothetical protein
MRQEFQDVYLDGLLEQREHLEHRTGFMENNRAGLPLRNGPSAARET